MDGTDRDTEAEAAAARAVLVRSIAAAGGLADPAWRAAFEEVPRHVFVPYYYVGGGGGGAVGGVGGTGRGIGGAGGGYERLWRGDPDPARRFRWLSGAYADAPLATRVRDGELLSSSSQPSLMALMLEALAVTSGQTVLEIGAGTGYNAALLCHRLGDASVTTVDLDPDITETARGHLAEAGYRPAVVTGDGALGCAARAPYDRIIATCALRSVPEAWLAQCRPGALILAPLATGLIALRVAGAGQAEGRFLPTPAFFVPLRGSGPGPAASWEGAPRRAVRSESFRFLLGLTAGRMPARVAYAMWERCGHPARERYGVSVRSGRQYAWLDSPSGPERWPLVAG